METVKHLFAQGKDLAADLKQTLMADKEKLWSSHNLALQTKDLEGILSGFAQDAQVLLVPTSTGASGADGLRFWYAEYALQSFPKDMVRTPVSLTASGATLVDESVFRFSHTQECFEFAPGIAPTGKLLEVPVVCIATFSDVQPGTVMSGVKIQSLRVYWDPLLVLAQLGLVDGSKTPGIAGTHSLRFVDPSSGRADNLLLAQSKAGLPPCCQQGKPPSR